MVENQGGRGGTTSRRAVQLQNEAPGSHDEGPSEPFTPANTPMEVSCDENEDQAVKEDLVSFSDVMDAADRAADAFESSVMSRVSDTGARRRRERLERVMILARNRDPMRPFMSPESSETEYSSDSEVSITIDGPPMEDFCQCYSSGIQGRQDVVIIHISSDSEVDVDID
jgi:hypothetical protein